ncbi:MAG: tetratricopeptide repeat protein, partial [Myxococcales bacterium]|nr:tetratricopeptide repeat protein [Myxococcales bacterium]
DLYERRGDTEKAREIRQRYVVTEGLSTSHPEFESAGEDLLGDDLGGDDLGFAESSTLVGDGESGILQKSELADDLEPIEGGDISELLADDILDEVDQEPVSLEEISTRPAPVDFDPEQLLAEASVYLRYGKKKEAIENLETILGRESRHRGALEKLGEAFADSGENDRAVQAWQRAIERAQEDGDASAVSVLRDRIGALEEGASLEGEPGGADTLNPTASIGTDAGDELDLTDDGLDIESNQDDVDLEAAGLDLEGIDGSDDAAVEADASGISASTSAMAAQLDERLEEADFYKQQGLLDEAEAIYRHLLESAPNHPLVLVRLGEIETERGEDAEASGASLTPPDAPEVETADVDEADLGDLDIDIDVEGIDEDAADSGGIDAEDSDDLSGFVEEISSPEPEPEPVAADAAASAAGSVFDLAAELTADANDSSSVVRREPQAARRKPPRMASTPSSARSRKV